MPPAPTVASMVILDLAVKRSSLEETQIADISRVSKSEVDHEIFDNTEVGEKFQ